MVVRSDIYYHQLFLDFGYRDFKKIIYPKDGMLDEKMIAYVLSKDVWSLY